ncbi:hypothetical protein [Candidatus Hodarchaeum mangrovi]
MVTHYLGPLYLQIVRLLSNKRKAVSPILATVIIFGLIITGVMMTFIQVVPFIERAQSEEAISTVKNSLLDLDTTIKTLISESGDPGGFRTTLFQKSAGKLVFSPASAYISLKLVDQDSEIVYNFTNIDSGHPVKSLDWVYNSPRTIVPRGTSKYLLGPDPYQHRDPVFLTGAFASTEYQELTNLTLSHLNDRRHHIILNYRTSIHLTVSTSPEPEIKFQVFFISLSANFDVIHSSSTQIKVHSTQLTSSPITLPSNPAISQLNLLWEDIRDTGTVSYDLWSTQNIRGLTQISYFNIVVQKIVYEIGLST